MWINEREGCVARERDALSRRPNGSGRRNRRGEVEFAGHCENAAAIDMRLDEIGDRLETRFERLGFARLHEAQMALGQRDLIIARQGADDRNTQRFDGLDDEAAMTLAADAIDNHA